MSTISTLSDSTSLSQQLLELKNTSVSTLLDSLKTTPSATSLSETIYSGSSDLYLISAVSKSLSAIATAAEASGVSEVMDNVRLFAIAMQNDGVDTASIMQYLGRVRELAETDPEKFLEIFSATESDDTDTTMEEIGTEDESAS